MAVTEQAIRDIALGKGGSYSLSRDVIKHYLHDTRMFATTISSNTFFTQPIGSTWGAAFKTLNETNMLDSGKLPNGQTFLIKKMWLNCVSVMPVAGTNAPGIAQAFTNIIQSSVFEIKIAGREYDMQCPGAKFLPPLSIAGQNATNASFRTGDIVASGSVNLADTPIFIANLVTFSVQMTTANPIAAVDTVLDADATLLNGLGSTLQVVLEGTLTRAK